MWLLGISVGVLRCYWRRHDHAQINWECPLLLTGLRMAGFTDGWRVLACLSDWQEGGKGGWVGMFSCVSWEWATGGEHLVAGAIDRAKSGELRDPQSDLCLFSENL